MNLLNPRSDDFQKRIGHFDGRTQELFKKTAAFFESKGTKAIKDDEAKDLWYDDFIQFLKQNKVFENFLIPEHGASENSLGAKPSWQTDRIADYGELLGFYGLNYWYCWQVSILGLGPIWMSKNQSVYKRAAEALAQGGLFGFALSEKDHGADIYSTGTRLKKVGNKYVANGSKYYIGNGNCASLLSTFAKFENEDGSLGDFVFFVIDPKQKGVKNMRKIETSGARNSYVSAFELENVEVEESDILAIGQDAFDMALNTVNVGKYQLGMCSIGIATHAFFEAINHAHDRILYGRRVTAFPHVRRLFVESRLRLWMMHKFGKRAGDYMSGSSKVDRRYLLFNPIMKMKVTLEGEKVVHMLHDVIAAKGFERETYFEAAVRDIGALPKLEGTAHVNMALVIKFTQSFLFGRKEMPTIAIRQNHGDVFLFDQIAGKLSQVEFPDLKLAFSGLDTPNIKLLLQLIDQLKLTLMKSGPTEEQQQNIDLMSMWGELVALIVYSSLVCERTKCEAGPGVGLPKSELDLLDAAVGLLIRDFSEQAHRIYTRGGLTADQEKNVIGLMSVRPIGLCEREEALFAARVIEELFKKY